jgi:hypothetical protein
MPLENAPKMRRSSISLRRIVGVMFTRVNSKCAHQMRPTPRPDSEKRGRWAPSLERETQGDEAVRFGGVPLVGALPGEGIVET